MHIGDKTKSASKPLMTLSAYGIQGRREHMEDFFDIGYQMKPCDQRRPNEWPYEYFYLGIFDGHGGHEAALYTKQNLLKFITMEDDFWSNDDEEVMRAIRSGFAKVHSSMRNVMSQWPRSNNFLPSTAGTTASILFIKNGKYYTGHVGDSRIVISEENPETGYWIHRQLTDDHKPELTREVERITRAGGEVKAKMGVHRVVWRRPVLYPDLGQYFVPMYGTRQIEPPPTYPVDEDLVESYQVIPFLAIARSLGDFWSINPHSGQYIVSPEPDVSCRPVSPNDRSILLATDGLWNVMNSSQATRFLQELNITKNDCRDCFEDEYFVMDNYYDLPGKNYAKSLVYFAYQMWERKSLRSDNVTAVVVNLRNILECSQTKLSKSYTTRSSTNLPEGCKTSNRYQDPIQIGDTKEFYEEILMDKDPSFLIDFDTQEDRVKRHILKGCLNLPPTLLTSDEDFIELIHPLNYDRLSKAPGKKFVRKSMSPDVAYVFIKYMSDDPADRHQQPTRRNGANKEVRDASSQATQNIHDFGQPWAQLMTESEYAAHAKKLAREDPPHYFVVDRPIDSALDGYVSMKEKLEKDITEQLDSPPENALLTPGYDKDGNFGLSSVEMLVEDYEDDIAENSPLESCDMAISIQDNLENPDESVQKSIVALDARMFDDDCNELINEPQLDAPELDDEAKTVGKRKTAGRKKMPNRATNVSKTPEPRPLTRCLQNSDSNAPRTRSNHLSMSENAKRRTQPVSGAQKSKRRKSQPALNNF